MTETRRPITVAAAQLTATADLPKNLEICRELAREAAGRGAELLSLPECFAFIGEHLKDKFAVTETLDRVRPGPIYEAVLEMATANGLWVHAGGLPERVGPAAAAEVTTAFNTAVLVSPAGECVAAYRKIHLFDIDIPGRAQFSESSVTTPGSEPIVAETELARLGLSICYDLRFPELYRRQSAAGAEILTIPAAFTAHTGAAHWHPLLRARAIENQCYVVAAAQTGQHNPKRASYGHSMIIDPWGTILAEVEEGQGLAIAEIDFAVLAETREQMPCLNHRVFKA